MWSESPRKLKCYRIELMVRRLAPKYNVFILSLYNQEYNVRWSTIIRGYVNKSFISKWLSFDILRVLFLNVCRRVGSGIISRLRTLWLLQLLCVCSVSSKRLVGL